jgi:hypothetical protein
VLRRYIRKWDQGTIDSGYFQIALISLFSLLNALLGLLYHTLYYYLVCYAPIFVIFYTRLADQAASSL